MYLSHFKLQTSPFSGRGQAHHFFQSGTHQEALARLEFLVSNRRTLGLLLGPAGSGKTLILQQLARRLSRRGCRVVTVDLVGLTAQELLWNLTALVGCGGRSEVPPARLWARLSDRLFECRTLGKQTVFHIDDLDLASGELQSFLIRLVHADPSPEACHTLIVACDADRLHVASGQLLSLVDLRVDLDPWSKAETGEYLNTALAEAGCRATIFDESAIAQIHELSGGIPRQVNRLADLALVAAAGQRNEQVDGETVAAVAGELVAC